MRRLQCFILGLFLVTVRAEKEDFQGYFTEQTKGTTVTKDLLLKKENTIGHGTEAIPTEKTHQHTAMAVTDKFLRAVLFDTRPTQSYKKSQITNASAVISLPSLKHFVSRNGQNFLTLKREPSAMRIDTESEKLLISNYEKISLPSVQAAVESMMNDTSEPEVNLTADAVKAPPWLHTLLDYRNQANTNSVKPTSVDGGLRAPLLSASHSRVTDNVTAVSNDSDDKLSRGKGTTNPGGNVYGFGTVQSIFQISTAGDLLRRNTITNLCLTCMKDRRPVSTVLSPHDSSDNNKLAASLTGLYQQSAREQEILNKDISRSNLTMHSSFSERGNLLYNQTLFSFSFNKTLNHSQSILNDSQSNFFSSDTEVVAFHMRPLSEMSSEIKKDTKNLLRHTYPSDASVTERPISTSAELYHSSKSFYIVRKPVKSGEKELYDKKVSIGDLQSDLIYFSKNNKTASHSVSKNLKSSIQNQPLDTSSRPVSNMPVITAAPHSSDINVLPEGSDHSTASHPAVRMSSTEAHSATTPFSGSRPTTLPLKNLESHFLTGRVDSLISLLRHQTPTKPSFQTKEPILTLLPKDSAIKLASATTKTHLTDKQDPLTFNAVHSIAKQSFVDPSWPMNKPVIKEPQTTTTATREVFPGKLFFSELRQDFGDDTSVLTLPTISSKSLSEKLTISRVSGTQSEIIQGRTFDVASERNMASTRQSYSTYNGDLIRESLRDYDTKTRDEEVLIVAAENGDKMENNEEIKTIMKLQEGEKNGKDAMLDYQREKFKDIGQEEQEKIINTGAKTTTGGEGEEMAVPMANTSREKVGRTDGEEAVTLRQNQDQSQGEVSDEEGAERDSVTKIYEENSPKVVAEKQREHLRREAAEARSEETLEENEDNKCTEETGKEDLTNVPLGPPTNSKEFNRDKGHAAENLSSCHSLIKQLGTTEPKDLQLGENTTPIVEIMNKSFSYKVTNNHRTTRSSLRYQNPNQSKTASLPKEPYTQNKSHLTPPRAVLPKHELTSSLAKESPQNNVVEATFSTKPPHTFGDHTLRFRDIAKPSVSPHSSAANIAHPLLNSISNMLSLTTHRLATTAGFLRAEPHFTVNSSSLNISIIYSVPDHRHKFSASVSKGNSILHSTNKREQAEYITPSVNPTPYQKMYNDSSTRPPTATALSSEAHISIGQLQPRQVHAAPQISESSSSSSSFDMTSGQPCSFKLSEQTAHPDALHTPVDGNKQRSVHTLTESLGPKAENDQFPPTDVSPLLNLSLFGGDILPGTYRVTELTRPVSEKNLLSASSNTHYANSESNHAESLLATAEEKNQPKENDNVRMTINSKVKHLELVTKQISETRLEKHSSPFISQITDRNKDHNIDELNSLSIMKTEKPVVKITNENDPIRLTGEDEANNTVTVPVKSVMLAVHTRPKTEQAKDDNFVYVVNDFGTPVLDTNAQSGTSPDVESDSGSEMQKLQANGMTNVFVYDLKHLGEKTTQNQDNPVTPQGTVSNSAPLAPHITSGNDIIVLSKFTHQTDDQLVNPTSSFQIIKAITNDSVSLAPIPTIGGVTVSREDHESPLMVSEGVPVVVKSSRASAEHVEHFNSHTETLSWIGPPITPTTSKLTSAVKRQQATEAQQSAEQLKDKISVRTIKQSQHAPPAIFATTHNINDPGRDIQTGLLQTSHRAEGSHGPTSTMFRKIEYSLTKDIKTALTTKSAFETKHPLLEKISTAHTQDRIEQPDRQTSHEKTSISQLISGSVTDSVSTTRISSTQIINKTSCRTIGCAQSTKATKTTTGAGEIDHSQKMYKTQGTVTERDHLRAEDTPGTKPENCSYSSDSLVAGKTTPQAVDLEYVALSASITKSDHGHETMSKKVKSMTVKTVHLERHWTPERPQFVRKTTQRRFHRETSKAREAPAKEVTLSEPEATALPTTIKATELTLLSEKNTKTQLNRGGGKTETFKAQNATRSVSGAAKEESGHRVLLPESEAELRKPKLRGRTSPHLYLSGITEVSEDLCGSGNYTAEMSLDLGRGVEPGDAVPARGNLRVVINLKTNNSQINLGVTSCCLSPTIQPDLANSTCCLFSRLAAEPAGITLLPTALSTSASFTISLFQMINYSVVYLHCDLSVCLRNHSDCERQCLQQRSALPLEGSQSIVTNLRNRISFGPMLKQVKNSTFPEEIDPSELDLVLVIVSLVVGSSLVTVMLLLVWLVYRKRGNWLLRSAAPPRACCGCLRPGGDLILP